MAIKPILFNTEMVRAILDGRKTCTRRLVRFLPGENPQWTGYIKDGLMLYNGRNESCIRKAPYQPGDILYVRETFAWCPCWDCGLDTEQGGCRHQTDRIYKKEYGCYMYRASCEDNEYPSVDTWHPSIHMPKEAARIFLKVKAVRVERLQEITGQDVLKEGLNSHVHPQAFYFDGNQREMFEKIVEQYHQEIRYRTLWLGRESVGMGN